MSYQAIARKYRPQSFEDVVGQEPIVRTLSNAISHNQVAHAYIFSGTRGVGKTTTARILAKALNCRKAPTTQPCGECPACTEIAAATAVDVIEIDAASNRGIDEIRELRENVRYLPARDPYKIFIIDEAHMLTNEAFNALLKTLEEPPPRVLFVLATTEPHKIPATIHSRCQSFHFRNIGFQEILRVLESVAEAEKAEVEKEALAVMARAAEGSLRDSLSVLEQAIAFSGQQVSAGAVRELLGVVSNEVLEQLVASVRERSSEKILHLVDALVSDGHNLQHFCREALRHIRNLLMVRIGGDAAALAEAAGEERNRLEEAARGFSEEDLLRFFQILLRTEGELRWAPQPRLHLELGLLKLIQAERLVPLEELLAQLEKSGTLPAPAPRRGTLEASTEEPAVRRTPSRSLQESASRSTGGTRASRSEHALTPLAVANVGEFEPSKIEAIRTAVYERSKLLGTFVDNVARWDQQDGELRLWFTPENRSLPEMLDRQQRGELERIISEVLGRPVRVQPRVGNALPLGRSPESKRTHPVVEALVERFGGRLRTAADLPSARRSSKEE